MTVKKGRIERSDTVVMTEGTGFMSLSSSSERLVMQMMDKYSANDDEALNEWMEQTRTEVGITVLKTFDDDKWERAR